MRQNPSILGLAVCTALATLSAGCGEALESGADEEEPLTEPTTSALAAGCAAIVVTSESHVGTVLGYETPKRDLSLQRLEYRIKNPSATNCDNVQLTFKVRSGASGYIVGQKTVTTSLLAGYSRSVYWNINFDSRTFKPTVGWDEEAHFLRNGNAIKFTFLPLYFIDLGQY